jgi:riboflavin synthase
MFTGLVEAIGTVRALSRSPRGARLEVDAPFAPEIVRGESVAVDGACLTAVEDGRALFDASPETLDRTTLGALRPGARVNLERALRVGDRLGGHWVLGHVDACARIVAVGGLGDARRVDVELPAALAPLVVEKGSIAVDGVSLTVNGVDAASFHVALIPETQGRTTLAAKPAGALVNLEGDVLGRFVLKALAAGGRVAGGLDAAFLAAHGYV